MAGENSGGLGEEREGDSGYGEQQGRGDNNGDKRIAHLPVVLVVAIVVYADELKLEYQRSTLTLHAIERGGVRDDGQGSGTGMDGEQKKYSPWRPAPWL